MNEFTKRAIDVIKAIPPGCVMSYGEVAARAGQPRGARQVVRILHSMSRKHNLPWHRVINAKGRIALKHPVDYLNQKSLLEAEGVVFSDADVIDMQIFRAE